MKFSIKDSFSKSEQIRFHTPWKRQKNQVFLAFSGGMEADLFTFTEGILDGKLHFLCSVMDLEYRAGSIGIKWGAGYCENTSVSFRNDLFFYNNNFSLVLIQWHIFSFFIV